MKKIFSFLGSKYLIIGMSLYTLYLTLLTIPIIVEVLMNYKSLTSNIINETEDIINNIATVLVAIGVYFETREIFTRIADRKSDLETILNHIAEENGAGLLVIGLFLELICSTIDMPDNFIHTSGNEWYLFATSVVLLLLVIPIICDLIIDFIKNKK